MAVFICDFGVEDEFLGIIIQCFPCVLEFTAVDPLSVNEFPDLCDELSGQLESHFLDSYVSEIHLFCRCEGFGDET